MDYARAVLLADGAVTEGFRGVAVEQDDGQLVLHFRWRRLPYPLQVRISLGDVKDCSEPDEVPATAEDWVHWLVLWLMEWLDTGGVAWSARRIRGDSVDLLLNKPRAGAIPYGFLPAYYVSQRPLAAWEVMGAVDLDVTLVREVALSGQPAAWWVTSVNNSRGEPDVAQLVVLYDGPDVARLQHLQVRENLPVDIPDSVIVEMLYIAVFDAACNGACTIVSVLGHPAQSQIGGLIEQRDGTIAWRHDGPFLEPPVQTTPAYRRR